MRTFTLILIITIGFHKLNAQTFAVINDKDGYVNVRKDKNVNSAIIGKIYDYSVFSIWDDVEPQSDWVKFSNRIVFRRTILGWKVMYTKAGLIFFRISNP